jgi:NAD(P)-dependent dehydrogenase (short-subunit alcohol dehydrogenase family)
MSDAPAQGRTLILTGASRGIGHATVKRFASEGWRVVTCSREDVPAECRRDPGWSDHIMADLADAAEAERFVREALARLGGTPVQALVNNAGVSPKSPLKERLGCLNGDLARWHEVFQLNFFTPLALARGFAGALHAGKGAIVNVTSIAGHAVHPFAGSANSTAISRVSAESAAFEVE